MGREVNLVPPNWEHPKVVRRGKEVYQPMHHWDFESMLKDWQDRKAAWERGEYPEYASDEDKLLPFEEWDGEAPDPAYYVPFKKEDCSWFQVWETVSEGTPVTPPFATKEELVEYLVNTGDFWDGKWSRESATNFVMGAGWVPSGLMTGGKFYRSKEIAGLKDGSA